MDVTKLNVCSRSEDCAVFRVGTSHELGHRCNGLIAHKTHNSYRNSCPLTGVSDVTHGQLASLA